jgi:hypothetical protein
MSNKIESNVDSWEITDYVEKITEYEKEFSKKSPSDKNAKNKDPLKLQGLENKYEHWITKDGRHIVINGKNA